MTVTSASFQSSIFYYPWFHSKKVARKNFCCQEISPTMTSAWTIRLWTIHFYKKGALGLFWSVFRFSCQKTSVFRFWCSMRFADFSFFSIWFSVFVKNTSRFSVLVPNVVFGFSYFFPIWTYLGSTLSLIERQWSLITETPPKVIEDQFCMRFSVLADFVGGFGWIFLRFCGF